MINLNTIFHRDCKGFMEELESNSIQVDIVVTSPPYNIGKSYGNSYNDNKPLNEYLDFIGDVGQKIKKVLKNDGSFFLNIGNIPSDQWIASDVANTMRKDFILQNTIMWNKSISIEKLDIGSSNNNNSCIDDQKQKIISLGHYKPVSSQRYLNNLYEFVFHFTHSGNVKLDKKADGFAVPFQDKSNIGRYSDQDKRDRGNSWFIPYETIQSKNERPHPAVFPIKLPYYCIKLHGYDRNTIVYDPFMGIGTTAAACVDLGVKYLGTEINMEYIQIAESILNDRKRKKIDQNDSNKQISIKNYL